MDDETYVQRRRWSLKDKRAVVQEALTSGNVIGTAKRHGIQAQQIYRWRERLDELLDKINQTGLHGLSDGERRELMKLRERLRGS